MDRLTIWWMYGAGMVAYLALRWKRSKFQRARLPPRDDPRWNAAPTVQVVGRLCAQCQARFVRENEALGCRDCGTLLHEKHCAEQHGRHAHLEANVPYR